MPGAKQLKRISHLVSGVPFQRIRGGMKKKKWTYEKFLNNGMRKRKRGLEVIVSL